MGDNNDCDSDGFNPYEEINWHRTETYYYLKQFFYEYLMNKIKETQKKGKKIKAVIKLSCVDFLDILDQEYGKDMSDKKIIKQLALFVLYEFKTDEDHFAYVSARYGNISVKTDELIKNYKKAIETGYFDEDD